MNKKHIREFLKKTIQHFLLTSCFICQWPVFANTYDIAEQLYLEGKFQESATIARKLDTAEAYTLAGKATLVEANFLAKEKDKTVLLQQVINDSEKALKIESLNLHSHLQIAMALGFIADHESILSTYFNGHAEKGKYHLEIALSIAPDDAWVNGLYGMWHLQVVRRATSIIAKGFYGASIEAGLSYCDKAQKLSANELQILYGCGISLRELDENQYYKKSCRILESIASREPIDIAETYIIQQATNEVQKLCHRLK